jgi:L-ascorbate metabolism protein UlaG (beta-lactamase superfamily)
MKKFLKFFAGGIALLLIVLALGLAYLLNAQDDLDKVAHLLEKPASVEPETGTVTVQYLGNTNLLFSDGETSILIDGWFTRPGTFETLLLQIEPDTAAIDAALQRGGVNKLAVVIPAHSHYDHAMDSPLVAERTGADLIGSQSTLNIARGLDFDETRFKLVEDRGDFSYGKFQITLLKSKHFAFPGGPLGGKDKDTEIIDKPLVPPVSAFDYKMGGAYSILIRHPQGSALVQGSAGFVEGLFEDQKVDVVFLGVGGLAGQSDDYMDDYWTHVVEALDAQKIYPVHWDSFTHPLGEEPELPNLLLDKVLGLRAIDGIKWVETKAGEKRQVGLLPMWEKVRAF